MRRPILDAANTAAALVFILLNAMSGAGDGDDSHDYGGFSQSLKDSLPDLQVIRPGLGESTAVIPGLRAVIRL